jgi:hypothetical protein
MSTARIEATSLWATSLSSKIKDSHKAQREELRSAFLKFRDNVSYLVSRIASHLPGLTQHEKSHLDALWETASLIAGEKYPLNALEGFILGGAILLHDAALCFEAFEGGLDAVRDTITWKDSYFSTADNSNGISDDTRKSIADFYTLRQLHASQAASLVEKKWIDPDSGQELYLIENQTLRKHLGQLIGEIAASHHWDIEKVASGLPSQFNALATFPREWRIDPIKIACLLRCADAAHIDNERAPDFLYALLNRQGVSFNHWQAQNRLASVDIDQSDSSGSTIIFTSTRNFTESESDSWWVAYDAAVIVDKEIRASNALLESKQGGNPTFKIKRVRGVESPDMMSKYIKVEDWTPCSAEIHVSNIEKLVQNLGGEKLYGSGNKLEVVLRELIQNSRDAIKARQAIDSDFKGRILIKTMQEGDSTWLIVEDNGVGMTQRVLTGPLLDFGTSFWKSSLVQSEFPGLLTSKFKASGQFGIGFYSIFMLANEVYVTTKPWKGGNKDFNQLHFKNGLSLRPLLKSGYALNLNPSISTQAKLRLKSTEFDSNLSILIKANATNSVDFNVPLSNYLSVICAGLDVDVYFSAAHGLEKVIHHSLYSEYFDKEKWVRTISFSEYQAPDKATFYINQNIHRLRPITEDGYILGLAAISTYPNDEQIYLNVNTVGGLASSVNGRGSRDYIGFIDYLPNTASRNDGKKYSANADSIKNWAEEQLSLLKAENLSPFERFAAASSLSHFNTDPTEIASILINLDNNHLFLTFNQLADLVDTTHIAIFKSGHMDHAEIHHGLSEFKGYALIRPLMNGGFITLKMKDGIPEDRNSLIGCLHRAIIAKGKTPVWTVQKDAAGSYFGPMDLLIVSIS